MLVYVFSYLFITFFGVNFYFAKLQVKFKFFYLFCLLLPAFLFAILKGNVGVDSIFYLNLFQDYQNGNPGNINYEPGFLFISKVISQINSNPYFGVASIASISTLLLIKFFSKSIETLMLFILVFFPIFYVDFTMNGIRYGLSFSIAAWAIYFLNKKKFLIFLIISIISISIQYSSIVLISVFASNLMKKRYFIFLVVVIISLLYFSGFLNVFLTYLYDKKDSYSELISPGVFSGIGPLIEFFLIFIFFIQNTRKSSNRKLLYLISGLEVLSFVLSKFSYAGLRFQSLFLFALILFIYYNIDELKENVTFFIKQMLFLSIFAFGLFLKNISIAVEDDLTPFLPYKFFWQENSLP